MPHNDSEMVKSFFHATFQQDSPMEKLQDDHLSLTDLAQRQLMTWNATEQIFPQDLCIPQLIEQQFIATPEALAVVMDNQQLTYKALNQQANQLAHHLKSCGVGPDTLVGICLE